MNTITLKLPSTLTRISGNDYGRHIYETQIAGKIDFDDKTKIIFPKNIEGVGISFVQGLAGKLIDKYGKEKIFDYIEFYSENQDVVSSIKESVEF